MVHSILDLRITYHLCGRFLRFKFIMSVGVLDHRNGNFAAK